MPQQSVGRQGEVTLLLRQWREGDQRAFERLSELVYDELRRMARGYLAGERHDHTLQPTALVHETYLRLVDQKAMPGRTVGISSPWRDDYAQHHGRSRGGSDARSRRRSSGG